jgi:hypothetical protein
MDSLKPSDIRDKEGRQHGVPDKWRRATSPARHEEPTGKPYLPTIQGGSQLTRNELSLRMRTNWEHRPYNGYRLRIWGAES